MDISQEFRAELFRYENLARHILIDLGLRVHRTHYSDMLIEMPLVQVFHHRRFSTTTRSDQCDCRTSILGQRDFETFGRKCSHYISPNK